MGNVTPWVICVGVVLIWPMLTFVVGFYVGRNGLPYDVKISKRPGWGRLDPAADYGFAADE
jgi:hypothetical protein